MSISSDIERKDVMYDVDEEWEVWCTWAIFNGILTGSAKTIAFTIVTPKIMEGVVPVFQDLKLNGRSGDGQFTFASAAVTDGYNILADDSIKVEVDVASGNMIGVRLTKKTGSFNGKNNTPVAIQNGYMRIKFVSAV